MKKVIISTLCGGLMACASSHVVPVELTAARNAYGKATASPGASLVLAEMHMAKNALDQAESTYKDDDQCEQEQHCPNAADMAYVAQRKAELAEAMGEASLAMKEEAETEKAITEFHAQAGLDKEAQLKQAKEELAKAQQQTHDALAQLSSVKDSIKQDERGLIITLSGNVLFASNKAELLPAARTQLGDIAKALSGAKGQKISIEGFTDATGAKERNEELSRHRAESVMNYLIDKGLPREHIRAVGRGPDSPIADNKTAEGRATNRRVEIVVEAEGKTPT